MTLLKVYYAISTRGGWLVLAWLRLWARVMPALRVRVVIVNELGELLLVREVIDPQHWSLPGGGVARRESPVAAARREVREELGLDIATDRFDEKGSVVASRDGARYDLIYFVLTVTSAEARTVRASRFEIRELYWTKAINLPDTLSPGARIVLGQLRDSGHI